MDLPKKPRASLPARAWRAWIFFLRGGSEVIVNEINTIPSFTKINMYPKLWEASGLGYSELIDRLIRLALERFKKEKTLRTSR